MFYLLDLNSNCNNAKIYLIMEQYIADGASLFITIVACIMGFAAAAGNLDFLKAKEEEPKED
jgi:hypothetical protein